MDYTPHTEEDIAQMKTAVGIANVEELFADIPAQYILTAITGYSGASFRAGNNLSPEWHQSGK